MLHSHESGQIRHHEKALLDILDTLPSIIVRVDRDGRVDLVNRRFEQLSGVSAADARGKLLATLIPQFAGQLQQVAEVIDCHAPLTNERIQSGSGADLRYYSLQIYPLNSGAFGMAVIRIDDVTEHVRIEEIMAQTEKMIMVGGLAAGMAHEINNPLGAIMQHAQNIERRVSPTIAANLKAADEVGVSLELVRDYLEKRGIFEFISHIRSAGVRASTIINNMLHFSRRSEVRLETVDLAVMLDRVLELAASDYDMKKVYDFRNIKLVREYAADMPLIAMTMEMEQVVINILKNAAQALSQIGTGSFPRIILRTRPDGDKAVIEIEDNGPGMDESTRLRVFEPFFSTKDVGVGTGLGLSVAYAIVTNGHHGTIDVLSQPGQGCNFIIKLPIQGRNL
ncbi:MAG: PAS domain-containing protein [Steroidobacteraceae bacterium]|nr:PAS domain-containing protein [Deltaproteobacteria bacterium]